MSFPGQEQDNPQRVSTAVNTAGFAQDVVMATSRLIHDQPLQPREADALRNCRDLLVRMLSTDITFARSGDRHLAETNTVALLRQTRTSEPGDNDDLRRSIESIDRLLKGDRTEEDVEQIRQLRDTFLAVAEVNLAEMTRSDQRQEGPDSWMTSIANLIS